MYTSSQLVSKCPAGSVGWGKGQVAHQLVELGVQCGGTEGVVQVFLFFKSKLFSRVVCKAIRLVLSTLVRGRGELGEEGRIAESS